MSEHVFNLPDVGEGLTEAEIVSWDVAPGDTVALNQVVCEIETAKSLVELPSPYAGVVTELLVEVGDTVPVGQPILRVSTGEATVEPVATPAPVEKETEDTGGAVLVGYGSGGSATSRRSRRKRVTQRQPEAHPQGPVLAKPPTRKLAKDHGINLRDVTPTGVHGQVRREDVVRHVEQVSSTSAPSAPAVAEGWPVE